MPNAFNFANTISSIRFAGFGGSGLSIRLATCLAATSR